jgi:hypothetical protein
VGGVTDQQCPVTQNPGGFPRIMEVTMAGAQDTHRKVLGIVGSPRRGGNTETLVDEVLAGAAEAGALTEKVVLSKLDEAWS